MKTLERIYPWLLISPVILPVVVWGGLVYPYLVPKTLLFYALSFLSVGAFVLLAAHGRTFHAARLSRKATWIPAALLALAYVASYFGLGFYHSFWSIFVRGDGLLMLTCAVASFYLILLEADRAFAVRLWNAAAVVGTFVAVYGIGEWLVSGGRIGSLLGNAAFFAGYLGISFFATLLSAHELAGGWRRAAYAGAALEVVAIILTATRGTILALGVALVAALGYYASKGNGRAKRGSAVALSALVVLAGLFVAFRSELAKVPFSPVARVASVSTSDPDVASRLFIWKNMLGQIAAHPLLGVGAEHIDALFNRFYDPTQIQEQWFDRSHNAFLDYAAEYGVLGFLLYVALIASFFVAARRFAKEGKSTGALLLSLLAVTYAVQNFFVFDTVSSFWLLLALLATALGTSIRETRTTAFSLPRYAKPLSWVAAAALVVALFPVCLKPAQAAYDVAHAYALALVNPQQSVAYLANGYALRTYGDLEYGYEAYDMYANHQMAVLTGYEQNAAYTETANILKENFQKYPYDARTALYLAQVLANAPSGATADPETLSAALGRTLKESPKRYQSWYILANLSIAQANAFPPGSASRTAGYDSAKDILNRYIEMVPKLSEPHFVLAQLDFATGDAEAAAKEAALGREYYKSDVETATRAAGYYESVKDWTDAEYFLQDVVRMQPSDYGIFYDIAKVRYLAGDKQGAVEIVNRLQTLDPSELDTDPNFIAAIHAYESSR